MKDLLSKLLRQCNKHQVERAGNLYIGVETSGLRVSHVHSYRDCALGHGHGHVYNLCNLYFHMHPGIGYSLCN